MEKNGFSNENYNLYAKEFVEVADSDLICYLDVGPTITNEDEEVYSDFVIENSLELYYDGQQFEDVLSNVLHQKSDATIDIFISAVNYYDDNDTFLDIE
ncbi:hypothetical protein [uncultured Maribacter sp.]|uniref:DUF7716 domain-containing protein n=1 Tax=uncultured Maribacter sp. TaxID=431308 RepID=UPI00261A703F|nr:hypothetical protein [uncultured Maribacter sp.]